MPRKANVTVDEAVQSLKKFIFHFSSPQLPRYSDPVWTEISKDLNDKWTPHNLYNNVVADRWGILTLARSEKGISIPSTTNQLSPKSDDVTLNDSTKTSTDSDEADDIGHRNNEQLFPVHLTSEEWKAIKPISSSGDEKLTLRKGVWTNVVAIAIAQQTKLPCAYVFKRAKVSTCDSKFVTIYGKCKAKSCRNELEAYIEKEPPDDAGVNIIVHTNDTRNHTHEVAKRPLNGAYREEVQKDLVNEGASTFRKRKARENMTLGDPEPPYLPNAAVLRQAKKQQINKNLGLDSAHHNLIASIEEIADRPEFLGKVHYIASRPFVVIYSSPSQLHAYKEYCKKNRNSELLVDASGSLMKKIVRDDKTRCGPLFLYEMVINFDHLTVPVHQMISEKHDARSIMIWIHTFLRAGAPKPKKIVCDYSRALLYALCREFNEISLKKYIKKCFKKLLANKPIKIPTHIRIDVAHTLHFISRWKCWKTVAHIEVKQFFLRCMGLMIQASDIKYLKKVLTWTVSVASHKYLDSVVKVPIEFHKPDDLRQSSNTVLNMRNNLEKLIGNKGAAIKNIDVKNTPDSEHLRPLDEHCEYVSSGCDVGNTNIVEWVNEIFATATAIEIQGHEMNPFYVPGFVPLLRNLAVEFPIWTNCTTPGSNQSASSAAIESYFNDLKTNVLKKGLRRADNFLVTHLRDIEGGCLLFVANTARHQNEKQASEEVDLHNVSSFCEINSEDTQDTQLIDLDAWSIENWGNQVPKTEFFNPLVSDDEDLCDEPLATVDSTWDHSYSRIEEEPDQREVLQKDRAITEATNVECTNALDNDNMKPKGTYLRSCPEIRYINSRLDEQPGKARRKMKECFLQNGSILQQPVKIDSKFYFVENTCAFDSVVQILLSGAIDHPSYDLAIQNSTNGILQFVARTLTTGVTKKTYTDRARLLLERYTAKPKVQTKNNTVSYTVSALDSVYNFINLAMKEEPSLHVIEECNRSCRREYPLILLSPNHNTIQKSGFGVLESALNMWPRLTKLRCFSKDCPGSMTRTNRPGIHLFIDADVRVSITGGSHGVRCSLGNLPVLLKLKDDEGNDLQYRLIGTVAYTPNHFTGYSYRNMMKWECSDDMALETKRESSKTEIVPHLVVYVRTSEI